MTTYSIADFLSIMSAKSMGFSVAKAQCLIVSPWADAAVGMSIQESTRATDMCVFPSLVEMLLSEPSHSPYPLMDAVSKALLEQRFPLKAH
ncbi:hypothetical protein N7497_005758 [Penicillium chrysogenum]|uniref:Uncharacterized protein n=1 Tax=Penicillium chrysogenum TaxID=5076 RepID=A0ABQ8WRP0_PENCH|nr:hypothetical protein N7505_003691 [Penicillium chrysogenum]KAJ5285639.1 hypothetical protein N7524_000945 [Penicillium chrysogenum]KAJ6156873.1 hypothetical protein N7497_005758 [Penicillium chrysogenum]